MKNYKYHRELRKIRDDLIRMKKEVKGGSASIGGKKIVEYGKKIVEGTTELIDKGFGRSLKEQKQPITAVQVFWMIFVCVIAMMILFSITAWHMSELNFKVLDLESCVFNGERCK